MVGPITWAALIDCEVLAGANLHRLVETCRHNLLALALIDLAGQKVSGPDCVWDLKNEHKDL